MPTISEPKDRNILYAKHFSVRYWFIEGSLGEATFRASLHILGLRGQDNISILSPNPSLSDHSPLRANPHSVGPFLLPISQIRLDFSNWM